MCAGVSLRFSITKLMSIYSFEMYVDVIMILFLKLLCNGVSVNQTLPMEIRYALSITNGVSFVTNMS